MERVESLIDAAKVKIITDFTVMPEKSKILTNLELLSPYIEFSNWVRKPYKNNTENYITKTKSTTIQIFPLKENTNTNTNTNNNLRRNSDSEKVSEFLDEEKQKENFLQLRLSLKDFGFLFSTFRQLKDAQKHENEVETVSLKVCELCIILFQISTFIFFFIFVLLLFISIVFFCINLTYHYHHDFYSIKTIPFPSLFFSSLYFSPFFTAKISSLFFFFS